MSTTTMTTTKPSKIMNIALWIAQVLAGVPYIFFGFMKATQPVAKLVGMQMHWAGDVPSWFLRLMGVVDMAGGIGLIVPMLVRIRPGLVVPAAAGCVALQVCAMVFHISRGEENVLPVNLFLLVLPAFVLWGRRGKV